MAKQEFPPLFQKGFHPMDLAKVRSILVDAFRTSNRRKMIMDGLEAVIKKLSMAKIECEIWVDGSFLTKKIDPFDSDILVAIQGQFYDSATPQQIEVIRLLITDSAKDHHCHSFLYIERPKGHPEFTDGEWRRAYWLRQFGFSRKDEPKGIITVKIP